jgi:hypothetical protein
MNLQFNLFELHDLAIPLVLADAIVIFSVICFNKWSSRVQKIRLEIDLLNQKISTHHPVEHKDLMQLSQEHEMDASVKILLQETNASWMAFPQSDAQNKIPQTLRSYRPYAEIWHIRRILKTKLNLELLEAMPNLLVGFGLMCTFAFLAVALLQTGQALRALDVSALQQETALQNLIATAGGKFIVSIAGLLCSLIWNWRIKVIMNKLQNSLHALCDTLKNIAPENATQIFMQTQLCLLQEISAAIRPVSEARTVILDAEK